jgi:hypothetical protein
MPRCSVAGREILRGGRDTVATRTLKVQATTKAKSYSIGDTARIPVKVTRPAGEDPLASGIPVPAPIEVPASGVRVGVGVTLGNAFLAGYAVTGVDGRAEVKVKIKSFVKPTVADVSVYTYNTVVNTSCLRLEENGYASYRQMFKVTR